MDLWLVVDVDGVLNSMGPTKTSFATTGYAQGFSWPLNLDKNHAKWLTDLSAETEAKLLWGTTWEHEANSQVGEQIGLPFIEVANLGPRKMSQFNADWKSAGVLERVGDDPGVWLDDDPDLWRYLEESNLVQVQVDEYKGLTETDIVQARQLLLTMKSLML